MENVVAVGVDGSEQARVAVLEAAEQAQRMGAKLRVICAVPQYSGSLAWVPAPLDRDALFADIKVQLDAGGADWLRSHFPSLPMETELRDGSPPLMFWWKPAAASSWWFWVHGAVAVSRGGCCWVLHRTGGSCTTPRGGR